MYNTFLVYTECRWSVCCLHKLQVRWSQVFKEEC